MLFILYQVMMPTIAVYTGVLRLFPTFILTLFLVLGLSIWKNAKASKMFSIISLFCIYIIINAFITDSAYDNTYITVIRSTFWCWCYFLSYCLFNKKVLEIAKYDQYTIFLTFIFIIVFIFVHSFNTRSTLENEGDNVIFYSLMLLPWIALMSNKYKKIALFALISFCVISSLKRSSLVILVISLVLIIYFDFFYKTRLTKSTIFLILLSVISLFTVYHFASERFDIISERMAAIEEDGGSGRDLIFEDVYNRYNNKELQERVFGSGFDAVRRESKYSVAVSAHNDFLEVLYDFGILGFILYILIHLSLIKWVFVLYKTNNILLPSVLISYFCFLLMSLVSHLVLYPTYFGILTSFWAYAYCKYRQQSA